MLKYKCIDKDIIYSRILLVSVSEPLRENSKLFSFIALKKILLNIGNI